jgi:hypothetical protein
MQAIRDLIDTEKLKHIMNIPENFGDKVEVIVLPLVALYQFRRV